MLSIEMIGIGEINAALKATGDYFPRFAERLSEDVAEEAVEEIYDRIQSYPVSGAFYTRYNPKRVVQASAPGEAPADDTGRLKASIMISRTKVNQYAHRREVYSNAPYAGVLEVGGFVNNGAYIAPRPFMIPGFLEAEERVSERYGLLLSTFISRVWS